MSSTGWCAGSTTCSWPTTTRRRRSASTTASGGASPNQWEALRYGQYYYGALECINERLTAILARSLATDSAPELGRLRGDLERASGRARMVLMELHDVEKYLKRSVRREVGSILAYWGFEQLVEQPVLAKIDACDARLRELETRRAARSSLFTDLILLGLGVTSILGTAVALAVFGRARTSDPSLSIYDLGRSDVVAWFAAQPADAILVVSGVTSLVLVVLYLFFRRTHDR